MALTKVAKIFKGCNVSVVLNLISDSIMGEQIVQGPMSLEGVCHGVDDEYLYLGNKKETLTVIPISNVLLIDKRSTENVANNIFDQGSSPREDLN